MMKSGNRARGAH